MQILDTLCTHAESAGITFLVVGGHAVNAYGVGRQTGDIDLLIWDEEVSFWRRILRGLDYRLVHEHHAFLQFHPPDATGWPIDLILVDRETMEAFHRSGKSLSLGGACLLRVPSALNLIALKLHALKQVGAVRELQDLPDIVALIAADQVDYAGKEFRDYCLHYGNEAIYTQIIAHCERGGSGSA